MNARPLIGISSNTQEAADRRFYKGKELEYGEVGLSRALVRAGALPVMVYRHREEDGGGLKDRSADVIDHLDGLLLSAGSDVAPISYHQEPIRPEWSGEEGRDRWEIALYEAALAAEKPVLGVCRGLQLINVAEGGTLWQDVETELGAEQHRSQELYCQLTHQIRTFPGSWVETLFAGVSLPRVNSVHHQSLRDVAEALTPTAWSPDGIIEAVERRGSPWVAAIQWHPEWMPESAVTQRIFERLVLEAHRP